MRQTAYGGQRVRCPIHGELDGGREFFLFEISVEVLTDVFIL